jgi:hypothetical protein
VLVILVAIAVVVAAIVILGDDERVGNGEGATPSPPSPDTALDIVDVGDHDPDGDLREWPDRVGEAIDGDPDTFWPTESYHDADIYGPRRTGSVCGSPSRSRRRSPTSRSTSPGTAVRWNCGSATALPAEDRLPSDWGVRIHEAQIGSAELQIDDLPDDAEGDTLLLWFTELPPGGNGYRGEIRDIRVYGG